MERSRVTMAIKREIQPSEIFEDLIVKLKNIYKEVYIFRHTFCVPGVESPDSVVGDIECILEPKYREAVEKLFPGVECLYLPSVGKLRDNLKEYNSDPELMSQYHTADAEARERGEFSHFAGAVIEKPDKINDCLEFVTAFEERFNNDELVWTCISDNEELIKTIYTDKAIFNLPIEETKKEDGTMEYITIAKQLLPMITEKNATNAFLNVKRSKEYPDLYEVLIDFRFSHFQLEAFYNVIPLPFV